MLKSGSFHSIRQLTGGGERESSANQKEEEKSSDTILWPARDESKQKGEGVER